MRDRRVVLVGLILLTLCSTPAGAQRGTSGATASSDVSSIDACALLTPAEIQQALGVAMKPGVEADDRRLLAVRVGQPGRGRRGW